MKINYLKNTSEVFDENMELLSMQIAQTAALYPDEGKVIRHIETGKIYNSCHIISSREKIEDYEEIEKGA